MSNDALNALLAKMSGRGGGSDSGYSESGGGKNMGYRTGSNGNSYGGGGTAAASTTTTTTPTAAAATTSTAPAASTSWASQFPTDFVQLLQQLSANAGKQFMPGGQVGAIRKQPFWSLGAAEVNPDPFKYGQTGGEATFFTQALGGGMAPLAASPGLGVPSSWNPLGSSSSSTSSSSSSNAELLALIQQMIEQFSGSSVFGEAGGGKNMSAGGGR